MRPGAGSQDGPFYPLMPGRRNPFIRPLEKALSIFCISRYCLSNWLTSWIDVPLPPAMRRRRQRHVDPGRQPVAQAVPRDAEDAQGLLERAHEGVSPAGHERVECTVLRPGAGSHGFVSLS